MECRHLHIQLPKWPLKIRLMLLENWLSEFQIQQKAQLSCLTIGQTVGCIGNSLESPDLSWNGSLLCIFRHERYGANFTKKNNFWLHRTKNHDFDETLDQFFNLDVDEYLEAPAPSMFLSFSSAKDSNYRQRHPKGHSGILLSVAKFEWFTDLVPEHLKRWGVSWKKIRMDRPEEYVAIRDRIGRRLLE